MNKDLIDFPIDLVYLWVDGSDVEWQKEKQFWRTKEGALDVQSDNVGRYFDNNELKYSLRSAEKYAPWIRKIFIVTNGQIPNWLNINHPKIQLVFHKDIMPEKYLPTFNSCAIECFLSDIPNLSEHFLYANDDTFFNYPVEKSFFFDKKGLPYIRVKNIKKKRNLLLSDSMYTRRIGIVQQKIKDKFGFELRYFPHHNIDAYLKSEFIECKQEFSKEFEETIKNRFRKESDIERFLISLYQGVKNRKNIKIIHRYDKNLSFLTRIVNMILSKPQADSKAFNLGGLNKNLEKRMKRYNPKLFCINDGDGVTDEERANVALFLEKLFPEKSSFEI